MASMLATEEKRTYADVEVPRWVGGAAIGAAAAAFAYAVAFVLLADPLLASLFLLLTGVLATPPLVALRQRLRSTEPVTVAWATLLAVIGALGSAIHGGYDLANVINPPSGGVPDLPNAVDPRGLLTFGFAGIGIAVLGVLLVRSRRFASLLGYLAIVDGLLLLVLYIGRLIVLDPTSPLILWPAVLTGFVVGPAFYLWLGARWLRDFDRQN
jgi:hypothetical protein